MPVTLTAYRAAVVQKGFAAYTDYATMDEAINQARAEFFNERRWGWMQVLSNTSLATVANVGVVATSPIADLLYIDSVRHIDGEGPDPVGIPEFRERMAYVAASGRPLIWTAPPGAGPSAINLGPRPDKVYTLSVDYVKTFAPLTNGDPTGPEPLAIKSAIVWNAAAQMAFYANQLDRHQLALQLYRSEVTKLARQEGLGQRQQSEQVGNSGFASEYVG